MKCLTCGTEFDVVGLDAPYVSACGGCTEDRSERKAYVAEQMFYLYAASRLAYVWFSDADGYAFRTYSAFIDRFPDVDAWWEWYDRQPTDWKIDFLDSKKQVLAGDVDITGYFSEGLLEETDDEM